MTDVRIAGAILVGLGGFALYEARRLVALRTEMLAGAVVGDDTFPLLVGLALLLVGGFLVTGSRIETARPRFAQGPTRQRMLGSAGLLLGYCAAMPYLGYTATTALAAVGLFRVMGGYRWPASVALGGALTGALYLLFRVWLKQPLPVGLLGG